MQPATFSLAIVNNQIVNLNEAVISDTDLVIYEVVRLVDGKILFLNDHLARFQNSFALSEIPLTVADDFILQQVTQLVKISCVENGNIKFLVVYHPQLLTIDFQAYFIPHSYPTEKQSQLGVPVSIARTMRSNPQAKVHHAAFREAMNFQITREGTYEILLIHPQGYVTEGSRSNLFMIKNEIVFTAPAVDILPGITRKYVLEICKELNLYLVEKRINETDLFQMDALFLTGTSPRVLPINKIREVPFDVNNKILRTIQVRFDEVIRQYLKTDVKLS